jgi:hypothetical protein
MGTVFSLPGEPSNYIQVNEIGLKTCLAEQTKQTSIYNCINQNILAPSNNTQIGVNSWNGSGLPPNPYCPPKQKSSPSTNQPNQSYQQVSSECVPLGESINLVSNFQNMESSSEETNDVYDTWPLMIILVAILCICLIKKI